MDVTKNFGAELGYVYFGNFEKTATDGVNTVSFNSKPQAFYVAATGTVPLSEQFSLFGKAGISANRTKLSARINNASASETRSETSLLLGLGAGYNITKTVSAVVEYENFGKVYKEDGLDVKADLVSVGLRYRF